jgi:hypothetical protein
MLVLNASQRTVAAPAVFLDVLLHDAPKLRIRLTLKVSSTGTPIRSICS